MTKLQLKKKTYLASIDKILESLSLVQQKGNNNVCGLFEREGNSKKLLMTSHK